MSMDPKPKTIAILATDSEFPNTAASGAREWASKLGLKLVYDRTFPPTTVDFTAVVRGVQASNPDVFFISCFPPETVGIISAVNEIGYKPRLMGGGMVGPQYSAVKQKLGPLLNGVMTFEDYVPELTANFEGIKEFLARYQPKAVAQGTDVLGFYLPPYAYAALQILGGAVEGTKGTDQNALGKYIHANVHKTVVGDIKFGANGEWAEARLFQVLYQGIVGNNVEQFKQAGKQVILHPPKYKSGTIIYPYPGAPQVILAMQGRSGGGGSVGRRGT